MNKVRGVAIGLASVAAIATAVIAPWEGLSLKPYPDIVGVWTNCYGNTHGVTRTTPIKTVEQCKTMLNAEVQIVVNAIDKCAPNMPPNVHAAFASAAYNVGTTIVCNPAKSSASVYLKSQQWAKACSELPKWNKGRIRGELVPIKGLTNRRMAERALCLDH